MPDESGAARAPANDQVQLDRVELTVVPATAFSIRVPARPHRQHVIAEARGGTVRLDAEAREQCRSDLAPQSENEPPVSVSGEIPGRLRRGRGRTRERDRDIGAHGDTRRRSQHRRRAEVWLTPHVRDPDARGTGILGLGREPLRLAHRHGPWKPDPCSGAHLSTGRPAATHAPKPPITSVVSVNPSSRRRTAARLEEKPSRQMRMSRSSRPVSSALCAERRGWRRPAPSLRRRGCRRASTPRISPRRLRPARGAAAVPVLLRGQRRCSGDSSYPQECSV